MGKKARERHPVYSTIERLLAAKVIWMEGDNFAGRASDGTLVYFGNIRFHPERIEEYLRKYPEPKDW